MSALSSTTILISQSPHCGRPAAAGWKCFHGYASTRSWREVIDTAGAPLLAGTAGSEPLRLRTGVRRHERSAAQLAPSRSTAARPGPHGEPAASARGARYPAATTRIHCTCSSAATGAQCRTASRAKRLPRTSPRRCNGTPATGSPPGIRRTRRRDLPQPRPLS